MMNNILNYNNSEIPENYFGFIYKTIFPNGKIYIGQTTKRVKSKYFGSGTKVHSYLKSKGFDNVFREILRYCNSQKELDKWEQVFVKKLDSTNPNIGYNIIVGAVLKFNPMKNPESVDKLRNYVLNNHPLRGIRYSDEYKMKMSEKLKQREFSGINNPMFGKKPHNAGKIVINNGNIQRFIHKDDIMPFGFKKGFLNDKMNNNTRNKVKVTITE